MEPIIVYLRRRLKEAGASRWAAIAELASADIADPADKLKFHSLRKIAYGDRENPGLRDVQRLIDFFTAVDRGDVELPESSNEKAGA